MFLCSFGRLFIGSYVRSFLRPFVSFLCSFVCLFAAFVKDLIILLVSVNRVHGADAAGIFLHNVVSDHL